MFDQKSHNKFYDVKPIIIPNNKIISKAELFYYTKTAGGKAFQHTKSTGQRRVVKPGTLERGMIKSILFRMSDFLMSHTQDDVLCIHAASDFMNIIVGLPEINLKRI